MPKATTHIKRSAAFKLHPEEVFDDESCFGAFIVVTEELVLFV